MEKFRCSKEVLATPMSLIEYNKYRGWTIPEEKSNDEGYLIEYLDGGKPNHKDHKGYISWSPKEQFNNGYNPVGTFLDRLILEKDELEERLDSLRSFIKTGDSNGMSSYRLTLLIKQKAAMKGYLSILNTRYLDIPVTLEKE